MKKTLLAVGLAILLSGCNTTKPMTIPHIASSENFSMNVPISEQPTFVLGKIIANIKRGKTIVHFPGFGQLSSRNINGELCNYYDTGESVLFWGAGSSGFGNWSTELGEVFYEVMSNAGYNVAGDPKDLFGSQETAQSAMYMIGARIKDIKGNICKNHSAWDGHPLGNESGEMYVNVEWTIYSNLMKKEVKSITTQGYNLTSQPINDGINVIFHNAFADSVERLAASSAFSSSMLENSNVSGVNLVTGTSLVLPKIAERTSPIKSDIDSILSSVVTVRVGTSHGSGFVLSTDGYLLTNAHVVGASKQVNIILNNGLEITGEVVNTNKQRDVALIKAPIRFPASLSVRDSEAKPLEDVFVVGSPILESLQSTITTGIISVVHKGTEKELPFIQSDVAVSSGNSGGPMLDDKGNVIAISVLKINAGLAEGLNFFIPIEDALRALNIQLK